MSGRFSVHVVDYLGRPIAGAVVTLNERKPDAACAITLNTGEAMFARVPEIGFEIRCEAPGYRPSRTIHVPRASGSTSIRSMVVAMAPEATNLGALLQIFD